MSPTVSTPALFVTAAIETKEGRDVATCDIPNAFIQTEQAETDKDGQQYKMKIRGKLAHLLVEIDPETYKPYLTKENLVSGRRPAFVAHTVEKSASSLMESNASS